MRDRLVTFKASDRELRAIDAAAKTHGSTRSKYLRDAATGRTIEVRIYDAEPIRDAYFELSRIGGNLNQIARHLNSARGIGAEDVAELKSALEEIRSIVSETKESLSLFKSSGRAADDDSES